MIVAGWIDPSHVFAASHLRFFAFQVEPERLDYIYLLPIFFDGLVERVSP